MADAAGDVEDLPRDLRDLGGEDAGVDDVLDEDEVPRLFAGAVDPRRPAFEEGRSEEGDDGRVGFPDSRRGPKTLKYRKADHLYRS